MRKTINLIWIASVFVLGCQTRPVAPVGGTFRKAKWETKAQIKELKKNKVHQVSIDVLAIKNEKMRMEITATLGYQVASILINREGFKGAVYPQKKFYEGRLNDRALSEVFNMPVSPRGLFSIAFDEPLTGPGWNCEKDSEGRPQKCSNPNGQIQVEWLKRVEGTRLVKITSPKVEVNWFFNSPDPNFEAKPEFFMLERPQGFQVVVSKVDF